MPCDTWSPTSPTTTSTCAAPTGGWTQRGRPPSRPAYLLTTSISSASPGEELTVRCIAIAFMGTISALVVLFSYHTSTDSQASTPLGAATEGDGVGSATTGTSGDGSTGTSTPPAT